MQLCSFCTSKRGNGHYNLGRALKGGIIQGGGGGNNPR